MRPKLNRINAKVTRGIYRDKDIEIIIGEDDNNSEILVNGVKLNNVIGAHIHIRSGESTKLCLELYKNGNKGNNI